MTYLKSTEITVLGKYSPFCSKLNISKMLIDKDHKSKLLIYVMLFSDLQIKMDVPPPSKLRFIDKGGCTVYRKLPGKGLFKANKNLVEK